MTNIQKLRVYNKITKPNWFLFLLMIIFNLSLYGLDIYFAVPSANVITSMTTANYNAAINWLLVCLAIVAAQYLLHTIIHQVYYVNMKKTYRYLYGRLYDKVIAADSKTVASVSKERIVNTAYGSVGSLEEFPFYFSRYISHFLQVIITVVLVLQTNLLIGGITIIICVLLFLLQNYLNKKRAIARADYYKYQDSSMTIMADTYNNRALTQDLSLESLQDEKFIGEVSKSQKANVKMAKYASWAENITPLICKSIVFALSIYMVFLTKSSVFTLALYLILVKYLTNIFNKVNSAQYVLMYINNAYVASMRFKTIFDMPAEDLSKYGTNLTDNIVGEIVLSNVSYDENTSVTGKLAPTTLLLSKNTIHCFVGAHMSGKRALFYMLNRSIKPTTGTITLGGVNIFDYDREIFVHNLAFSTSKPYFYNDTIMNNLLLSGANKTEIYQVCKKLHLHDKIVATSEAYKTNLSKNDFLSDFDKYLLGLARAICTNAEVIILYELPAGITAPQKNILKEILQELAQTHTVLFFTASDIAKILKAKVYKVEKGVISKQ